MADSDNSMTLPSVTRRRLMMGAAVASVAWPSGASAGENMSPNSPQEDPSLRFCEQWREVHSKTMVLCRRQQVLEAQLIKTIGFPARDRAVVDPAAHQARWDAMDDQIGYSKMDGMIRQSEAAEQALLSDLLQSPAATIQGVLAKLSVILCEAEHREDPDDFPWAHIRVLRNDLIRLHGRDIATTLKSEKQQNSQSR
jgi:hypothetical protein